ncbi:MAG: peptidoglycan DD-metalloendopeptidase family protein [Fusobacteria bacterium]|nr:peptidoglycan DD-metalloendopeptidase family protein [Fusobacteriota bacterium]
MRRALIVFGFLCVLSALCFAQSLQSLKLELQSVQNSLDHAELKLNTLKVNEQQNNVLLSQLKQSATNGKQEQNTATFQAQRASAYVEASQEKLSENQPLVDNLKIDITYNLIKYYQLTTLSSTNLKEYRRYQEVTLLKNIIIKEQNLLNSLGETQSKWQNVEDKNQTLEQEQLQLISELSSKQSGYQNQITSKIKEIVSLQKEKTALTVRVNGLQKQESNLENQIASIIQQSGGTYQLSSKQSTSNTSKVTTVKNGLIVPAMSTNQVSSLLGKMLLPLKGRIIISFGEQKSLNYGVKSLSRGLEISTNVAAKVQAVWAGKVIYAAPLGSLENVVILDNGSSVATVYGNLTSCSVSVGEVINKGAVVGSVSSGNNLYFEVRFKGVPVNPKEFF